MSSSTEARFPVARLGRPHGVRGAVTAVSLADEPELFAPGAVFHAEGDHLTLTAVRKQGRVGLILTFAEVSDRSAAEKLRGRTLTTAGQRRRLSEGEYWPDQLTGLTVVTSEGRRLGHVSGVVAGREQDRLIIELLDGRVAEVPFVDALVPFVSLEEGAVTVVPIEGLLS